MRVDQVIFHPGHLRRAIAAALLCGLASVMPAAHPATLQGDPDSYRGLLKRLRPGDTLRLAGGIYRRGLPLHAINGAPGAPVVIEGSADGAPAVFWARPGHNTVSVANASYVTVRYLVLDGRGTTVDAVKAEGFDQCDWVHHITLEHLRIYGHGQDQQQVGISTKCPAWDWVIRGNTIIGAGTGMYLGNSDGNAPFIAGLIENNFVADTLGYNLEIKHQLPRPQDLPGMPQSRQVTIIRHNLFSKAHGSGAKAMVRPNVLVGHWPLAGPGVQDDYLIYGNLFYQNPSEALFQGEGNLALYDNLFVNAYLSEFPAIAIQPHNAVPRRIRIFHNTVVSRSGGIAVRAGTPPPEQLSVLGNAVFSDQPLLGVAREGNLTAAYRIARVRLRKPFAAPSELDLNPRPGALRDGPELAAGLARLPHSDRDFTGAARTPRVYGACAAGLQLDSRCGPIRPPAEGAD